MNRWLLTILPIAACDATLDPDPPHELPYTTRSFSVAHRHTVIVTEFDPMAADNVEFEGSDVPGPRDQDGNLVLDLPASVDVAVGASHACVISSTGTVHCWGDHTNGALGESRACTPPETEGGAPNCILGPEMLPSLPPVRDIAAGDDVTCAITMDDRVVCWGVTSRLGGSRLPALDPPTPVKLPTGESLAAARVVISFGSVCAIARDQVLWCWGDGFGATPQRQPEVGVVDIALGVNHSCIIDADGLHCSGDNRNGQAGDFAAAKRCKQNARCTVDRVDIDLDATRVVVGERHTCALVRDGSVVCFGSNEVGQLGRDDAFLVGDLGIALDGAVDLQSGYAHVCAQRTDQSLWCWGSTSVSEVSQ
jgi:alpha-tubulin suppressor-like RCC1 family protein